MERARNQRKKGASGIKSLMKSYRPCCHTCSMIEVNTHKKSIAKKCAPSPSRPMPFHRLMQPVRCGISHERGMTAGGESAKEWPKGERVRGPVSRVLSTTRKAWGATIHLGRPLPAASSNLPGRRSGDRSSAVPMRSCSRWGLPCPSCCQDGGALLPHPFTLTTPPACLRETAGGLLSVALSLESPPPGVTRHRVSVEPGLSSPAHHLVRRSGRPAL